MKTTLNNPLNDLFDIEPDNEVLPVEYGQIQNTQIPTKAEDVRDEDDIANDRKIDQIYDVALETFHNQTAMIEIIEPRYAARNAEVAATYLNIALQAATARARVKADRKRATQFIPGMGGKVTNNTIVATREEIMKMISVDADTKELK